MDVLLRIAKNVLKFVALCKHLEHGSRNWCLAYAEYAFINLVHLDLTPQIHNIRLI